MKEQTAIQPIVLDCTLRDGGYYNNWDFDAPLVEQYLKAMAKAGVEIVEMGFRFTPKDGFLGANAFTTDTYLRSLSIPENLKCAVMINGADFLSDDGIRLDLLDATFNPSSDSPVSLIRIAINVKQSVKAEELVKHLKALDYDVGFNLMQVSTVTMEELADITAAIKAWDTVDVLYFADSLGNMDKQDISDVVSAMTSQWDGPLGIHAHNNMGKALDNTLHARCLGVEFLDCTVTGMGRGAGNAQTEYLVLELESELKEGSDNGPLMQLVAESFSPMKNSYQWGENLFYRLAAKHSIHPSYVQSMLQHDNFTPTDILTVLDSLSEETSTSYSSDKLTGAMRSRTEVRVDGSISPSTLTGSAHAILLAAGEGGKRHLPAVLQFKLGSGHPLYSINTFDHLPEKQLAGVFMCDPTRIMASLDSIRELDTPVVMPKSMLTQDEQNLFAMDSIVDIGVSINETPETHEVRVCIPMLLTMAYAIQILYASGVRTIFLAGFDGYKVTDPLHEAVEELLALYAQQCPELELIAVTPTSYSIKQQSVYSLLR